MGTAVRAGGDAAPILESAAQAFNAIQPCRGVADSSSTRRLSFPLVVISQLYIVDVLAFKAEDDAPVYLHRHRPIPFQSAFEGVQPIVGKTHRFGSFETVGFSIRLCLSACAMEVSPDVGVDGRGEPFYQCKNVVIRLRTAPFC